MRGQNNHGAQPAGLLEASAGASEWRPIRKRRIRGQGMAFGQDSVICMHPIARTQWHRVLTKHFPLASLLAHSAVKGEDHAHRDSVVGLIGLVGLIEAQHYPSLVALGCVQV